MGSNAMIYKPTFIKIVSGIQHMMGEVHRHADTMAIAYAYFYFFLLSNEGK
jgi:hypothetical protein